VTMVVMSATVNASETPMADTTETGIPPIEEGKFVPESLRFESEPWTPFYMAGEIIRESRKGSGKQCKYASQDHTAHSDEVIDHNNHPRNVGCLPEDDANLATGLVGAPEFGDVLELQMGIECGTQVIEEAEFNTFGCGWAIAVPSLPTEWVKCKTSRKHWPSRTRISPASSAFPRAILSGATRYSRIGGRLHLG
jgi:hypothetical protein